MDLQTVYAEIDSRMQEKTHIVMAIDGPSATGKTTLADILQKKYGASVIHMDDFFLPMEKRTKTRLAEAGGNVDYERFTAEVLPHMQTNTAFSYRRFDCHIMDYGKSREVPASRLTVVEGCYSMHPVFGNYADMTVFTKAPMDVRKNRILKRDGKEKWEMFQSRWIPMEDHYFKTFSIEEKADITIDMTT